MGELCLPSQVSWSPVTTARSLSRFTWPTSRMQCFLISTCHPKMVSSTGVKMGVVMFSALLETPVDTRCLPTPTSDQPEWHESGMSGEIQASLLVSNSLNSLSSMINDVDNEECGLVFSSRHFLTKHQKSSGHKVSRGRRRKHCPCMFFGVYSFLWRFFFLA